MRRHAGEFGNRFYAFLTFTGAQASMWPDVASIQPIL